MSNPSSILVGFSKDVVWIRVEGKGSFQNSPPLKAFAKEMLSRGHREFFIDLKECSFMDSTFMGTLASIAIKLGTEAGAGLHVVNPNERNQDLLCNLGLDQLLKIESSADPVDLQQATTLEGAAGKLEQARVMLEAHEAVVEANPQNEARFKDVLDFLRQDVDARQ